MSIWTIMNGVAWLLCGVFILALAVDVIKQEYKRGGSEADLTDKEETDVR